MVRTAALLVLLSSTAVAAQVVNSAPQPTPIVDTIPAARDVDYPGGVIQLDVDASDTRQGIFKVRETIPVADGGHMVLLSPKWLPGNHGPRGQIEKVAGLKISAGGKAVPWRRDPVDVYAFHIEVPKGAKAITAEFQFLSATAGTQGRIVMTPAMLNVQWEGVSLYPAGYFTRRIPIQATVKYPAGWTAFSGLPSRANDAIYSYQQTTYDVLVDSPTIAGRYAKSWQLSPRVFLDTIADTPEQLAATPEQIDKHKALVDQAVKLFGAQHYDNYHFLFSISDEMGGNGLEHHRSSEDGVSLGYFTEWKDKAANRNLLPHEFTHSWDGKFRRGADLWTPDFRTPMRDSLLWVYEGQTQFWGYMLQARSGLVSKDDTLAGLAAIAANLDNRPARSWRPLIDTTNDPIITARRPKGWVSWQRSEDYYNEGLLVWLEVDATLRKLTQGQKSMDDFARGFFGMNDGDFGELTYTYEDVVATLNGIAPYDWKALLDARLNETAERAPLTGLTENGYRLVYTDTPTDFFKSNDKERKQTDLSYSLGLVMGKEGAITSVTWDSPAFNAGLDLSSVIVAVNGDAYTDQKLKDAIVAAKGTRDPIRLLVKDGTRFRETAIDYHDGPRYPRLEKIGTAPSGLDRLLAPR